MNWQSMNRFLGLGAATLGLSLCVSGVPALAQQAGEDLQDPTTGVPASPEVPEAAQPEFPADTQVIQDNLEQAQEDLSQTGQVAEDAIESSGTNAVERAQAAAQQAEETATL
ncbi:MAG: hypothetical protein HC890_07485, partial [Chloroflexaceae bacterium]|nr:hypothetical protein [Chloroflexaceae bacterium]